MGVMLYLLLTGTYPFEDRQRPGNVTATLRRVREGKINPFPDRVCPYAQQLVRHMIRVAPRRRAKLSEVAEHPWLTGAHLLGGAGGSGGGRGNRLMDAAPAGVQTKPPGFARRLTGFINGIFGGKGRD